MLIFNSSLGIDFKRNHLILTLLKKSFGKIRLEDYRIYPLWSEGQKEVREAQWISLITTFISKHQVNKERVSISIPREKVIVRFFCKIRDRVRPDLDEYFLGCSLSVRRLVLLIFRYSLKRTTVMSAIAWEFL